MAQAGSTTERPWHHTAPRHAGRLLVSYLRLRYTDRYLTFFNHLRTLPRAEAWTARAGLAVVAAIVLAMPVLAWLRVRLPGVAFQNVDGSPAGIPEAGLVLTLLAFAAGWAYALAGAAQGPGVLWLFVGVQYVYFVVFIGLARTPLTYLQLIPFLLAVVVGALTPNIRPWAQYLLIALVASIIVRTAPLADRLHGIPWPAAWVPAAAVLVLVHHLLARRPWRSAGARAALAAGGTGVYVAAVARIAGRGDLATALNVSLSGTFEILSLLWFVLGAAFVGGGLGLAKLVREGLDTMTPARAMPWLAGAGWLALLGWTLLRPPACGSCAGETVFPVTPVTVAVLGAFLALLAAGARRRVLSRDWLAGWLVASLAAVLVLRAYATHGLRGVVAAGAGAEAGSAALAIAGFLYAITWEVSGELAHIPLSTPRLARPSPLLLFLAGVVLISGAALFGTTAGLTDFQKYIILNEYQGAAALSIPLALLAGARMWPVLTPAALSRAVTAFYWGAVLAVPAFLLRAAALGTAAEVIAAAAPAGLAVYLLTRWTDARAPAAAAAVGAGAALGFMVSLTQRVLVGVLQDVVFMTALLLKNAPLRYAAVQIRDWQTAAITIPRDDGLLAAVAAILAAGTAWAVAAYLRRSTCPPSARMSAAPTETPSPAPDHP